MATKINGSGAPAASTNILQRLPTGPARVVLSHLSVQDQMRTQCVCREWKSSVRLLQQMMGVLNGDLRPRYLRERAKALGVSLTERQIREADIRDAHSRRLHYKALELFGYNVMDLVALFPPQASETQEPLFPNALELQMNLEFSSFMHLNAQTLQKLNKPKGKVKSAPLELCPDETIYRMLDAASFHCQNVERLQLDWVSAVHGLRVVERLIHRMKRLTCISVIGIGSCRPGVEHACVDGDKLAKLCPTLRELRVLPRDARTICEDDESFVRLFNASQLSVLHTSTCGHHIISDRGMGQIPQGHGLTDLSLCSESLTSKGLENIAKLPRLSRLCLNNCPAITDLSCLARVDSLRCLVVNGGFGRDGHALLRTLGETQAPIDELRLLNVAKTTDESFVSIGKLSKLRVFVFDYELAVELEVSDRALQPLAQCKELQHLAFRRQDYGHSKTLFSRSGLEQLALALPKLRTLDLSQYKFRAVNVAEIESTLRAKHPNRKIVVLKNAESFGFDNVVKALDDRKE